MIGHFVPTLQSFGSCCAFTFVSQLFWASPFEVYLKQFLVQSSVSQGCSWGGEALGYPWPPHSFYFLRKTKHRGQHDNLVSTLCLTVCLPPQPPFEKSWLGPQIFIGYVVGLMVSGLDSESRKLSKSIDGYWTELPEQSDEILGGNLEIELFFLSKGEQWYFELFHARETRRSSGWVGHLSWVV